MNDSQVAQGIHIANLTGADIGRWVKYVPGHGPCEFGRIKSWNEKWIFVVYDCAENWDRYREYPAAATEPAELEFGKLIE